MEPVCFLCQDYKVNVSHETSSCPNCECKKCGQIGHFRWDCLVDDGSLIQPEVCIEMEIKSENCIKKEIKTENCIKKEIKTENVASDEFSKEEEQLLMYCLESSLPHGSLQNDLLSNQITKKKLQEAMTINKNLSEKLDLANQTILEIKSMNNAIENENGKLICEVQKLKDEITILNFQQGELSKEHQSKVRLLENNSEAKANDLTQSNLAISAPTGRKDVNGTLDNFDASDIVEVNEEKIHLDDGSEKMSVAIDLAKLSQGHFSHNDFKNSRYLLAYLLLLTYY